MPDGKSHTTASRRITRTFPRHRAEPLLDAAAAVAESRIAHLEPLLFREPPRDILVSAYMQGIVDAYDAMTRSAETHG
jgi:hypothetical protein